MMKTNNITELVFILDRSGSMAGLESDTIGGFNSLIEKQKKEEGECFVTTVLFDHEYFLLHDRIKPDEIQTLTEQDYQVRGCTALIDAIGKSIKHIEQVHRYQREEDVPSHTMFVITTDGLENASREFSSDKVKKLIERHKEKDGWEFLFIGANIDAIETARHYGIGADRAVNYHADAKGTEVLYASVADAVSCVRAKGCVSPKWSEAIAEDFEGRK